MGFLRELFGPSKEEVWRQLAQAIGGRFTAGSFFRTTKVQARVQDWILTLDTYSPDGKVQYTRLRAPYLNPSGFRFAVYRRGPFTEFGKRFLGVQDVEVGDPLFDQHFLIQGNDEDRIRRLFANPRIRHGIEVQPAMHLEVKDDEGWFEARFPAGVDELRFLSGEIIRSLERLRALYDLFVEVLNHLCQFDAADQDEVSVQIRALLAPGGQVEKDGLTLWEGDLPRRRAVDRLAHLGDPRAVRPLIQVLGETDPYLRARAALALGELGSRQAVPALVPLLGDPVLRACAALALGRLGEAELADRFAAALAGDRTALEALQGPGRRAAVAGLIAALAVAETTAPAAAALAALGATDALPALRTRLRSAPVTLSQPDLESVLKAAIAELEQMGRLLSPAAGDALGADTWLAPADQRGTGPGA